MPAPRDVASEWATPLSWWGHTWRTALCLLISGLVWGQYAPHQLGQRPVLFWVDLCLGVASFVAMFYRRRWPMPVAVALNAATLVSGAATGPAVLALVSLATRRVYWQIAVASVTGVVAGWLYVMFEPRVDGDSWWVTLSFAVVATVAMVAVGLYVGSRRELLWNLRDRARSAEEQQELRMNGARAAERERIAREMHDVLAHRISMVSMHAGALAFRDDLPPEQVRESAALIQTAAHQALTDLREVLGVLRDDGTLRDRPQPTMRDVPHLVAEARDAGMNVDLDLSLASDDAVPDQVGRTVYRIVQEGLTNARKHARGTQVRVQVVADTASGVDIWVRNPLGFSPDATPGSGLGLVGLRERAELAGGRLDVHRERDGFALHGWVPWSTWPT